MQETSNQDDHASAISEKVDEHTEYLSARSTFNHAELLEVAKDKLDTSKDEMKQAYATYCICKHQYAQRKQMTDKDIEIVKPGELQTYRESRESAKDKYKMAKEIHEMAKEEYEKAKEKFENEFGPKFDYPELGKVTEKEMEEAIEQQTHTWDDLLQLQKRHGDQVKQLKKRLKELKKKKLPKETEETLNRWKRHNYELGVVNDKLKLLGEVKKCKNEMKQAYADYFNSKDHEKRDEYEKKKNTFEKEWQKTKKMFGGKYWRQFGFDYPELKKPTEEDLKAELEADNKKQKNPEQNKKCMIQ